MRFALLHRYVRRVIGWAASPSDEEMRVASEERRCARLLWKLSRLISADQLAGLSLVDLDQMVDDIKLLRAQGKLDVGIAERQEFTVRQFRDSLLTASGKPGSPYPPYPSARSGLL